MTRATRGGKQQVEWSELEVRPEIPGEGTEERQRENSGREMTEGPHRRAPPGEIPPEAKLPKEDPFPNA